MTSVESESSLEVFGGKETAQGAVDDGAQCVALGTRSREVLVEGCATGSCRVWDLRATRARSVRRLGPLPGQKDLRSGFGCQAVAWTHDEGGIFTARGPHIDLYDLRKTNAVLVPSPSVSANQVCPKSAQVHKATDVGANNDDDDDDDDNDDDVDEINSLHVCPLSGLVAASRDDGRVSVLSFSESRSRLVWESPDVQSHSNICSSACWTSGLAQDNELELVSAGLDCKVKCWGVPLDNDESIDETRQVEEATQEQEDENDDDDGEQERDDDDAVCWEFTAEVYEPSADDSTAESSAMSNTFAFNPPFVNSVSALQDRMVVGMGDGTIGFWHLGEEVCEVVRYPAHRASVAKVLVREEGRRFFSASNDRVVSLWRSPEESRERPVLLTARKHTHKPNDFCAPDDCSFVVLATTRGLLVKYIL